MTQLPLSLPLDTYAPRAFDLQNAGIFDGGQGRVGKVLAIELLNSAEEQAVAAWLLGRATPEVQG